MSLKTFVNHRSKGFFVYGKGGREEAVAERKPMQIYANSGKQVTQQ